VREGLTCVLSVKVMDPQFEGQTKTKLGNSEVKGAVEAAVNEHLNNFLEENPKSAKAIIEKSLQAARAREAARKARDLVRKKSALEVTSVAACTRWYTARNTQQPPKYSMPASPSSRRWSSTE